MLIIDMPMPTRCDRCPCALVIDGMWYCKAFDDSAIYGNPPRKRRDWCPIKGVLPDEHGDLIDRDELKEKKVYSHERHEYVVPVAYIDWQDAVIKAERKDDEQIH